MAPFVEAYTRANLFGSPTTASLARVVTPAPTKTPTPVATPSQTIAKSWPPNIQTDYENLWPLIALRHTPPGPSGDCVAPRGNPWNGAWVKSFCVTRSVYYVGTCSGQAAIQSGELGIAVTNTGAQAGTTAVDMIAKGSSALPIIGLGVGIVTSIIDAILAHHIQAVQNEQAAECQIKQLTATYIPQIDAAVQNGQISATQGVAAHLSLVTKCKAISAPVAGVGSSGHPCNAGCCFNYFLDCLQDFAENYYPDLAPPSAPMIAPAPQGVSTMNSLSSQQIATSTAPVAVSPATYSPAAQASVSQAAIDAVAPPGGSPVVGTPINWSFILVALLGIGLVIWFLKH